MERKIGEVFTYNGKIYKVVPNSVFSCEGCAFKASCFCSADSNIVGKCFKYLRNDKTRIIFKEVKKHMDIKNNQLIIEIPEGMEIDLKNSDLANGIVKFKKKRITYESVEDALSSENYAGAIINTSNGIKLEALNKLMNIAKYYNKDWKPNWNNNVENKYFIVFDCNKNCYSIGYKYETNSGNIFFKNRKDAQAVVDNPNFKDILDSIYKD